MHRTCWKGWAPELVPGPRAGWPLRYDALMIAIHDVIAVFLAALGTALATGLGALPFLFLRDMSARWIALASAIAAGFMIGASLGLSYQGSRHSWEAMVGGVLLGYLGISLAMRLLDARHDGDVDGDGDGSRASAGRGHGHSHGLPVRAPGARNGFFSVSMRIVLIMTIHSFSEGVGVGVGWGSSGSFGLVIAIAIAVHNIPEGLAISVVLIARGESVARAAWMSIVSSLPQPVMAVPAFLFVESFSSLLPWGLGFAAGAMFWMTATDLLPTAIKGAGVRSTAMAAASSGLAMLAFQIALLPK